MIEPTLGNLAFATLFVLAWGLVVLYGVSTYLRVSGVARARRYRPPQPPFAHGPADVQVRVVSTGDGAKAQTTVDSLLAAAPDLDIRVLSETPIDVEGATVHVVPAEFACDATPTGRAHEWARQHVPCHREYVLSLKAGTHVTDFHGVPDADVVQFRGQPTRTGSPVAYLATIAGVGGHADRFAFPTRATPPAGVDGCGLAVRHELDQTVGWDDASLLPDSAFLWRAVRDHGADVTEVSTRWETASPRTISESFRKRLWQTLGTLREWKTLPPTWLGALTARNLSTVVWPVVPVLLLLGVAAPVPLPVTGSVLALAALVCGLSVVALVLGVRYLATSDRPVGPVASESMSAGDEVGRGDTLADSGD
ncbi:hypothetical protein [Haloarchaeobius sp. DFWS5]|uniref:hypothetical protein n=1 Tax=Haloarchaeobius sp. DFWS5 TaxID=3446114 RepID=UPI003EBC5590